jgi:hypothetical protein
MSYRTMAGTDVELEITPDEAEQAKRFFDQLPCGKSTFKSTGSVVYQKKRDPRFKIRVIPRNADKKSYRFMFTMHAVNDVYTMITEGNMPSAEFRIKEWIDYYATEHPEEFFDRVIQTLPEDIQNHCIFKMDEYRKGHSKKTKSF